MFTKITVTVMRSEPRRGSEWLILVPKSLLLLFEPLATASWFWLQSPRGWFLQEAL